MKRTAFLTIFLPLDSMTSCQRLTRSRMPLAKKSVDLELKMFRVSVLGHLILILIKNRNKKHIPFNSVKY